MVQSMRKQLKSYGDDIQAGLDTIQQFRTDLQVMNDSMDPEQVHEMLLQLVQIKLDDEWVVVPRQYKSQEFFLMGLDRFLEFAGQKNYDIKADEKTEDLMLTIDRLKDLVALRFERSGVAGAYLVEDRSGEKLLFWDLRKRMLTVNPTALVNLLVVKMRDAENVFALRQLPMLLLTIGRFMADKLGYEVDLNILENQDDFLYHLVATELPSRVLDQLFVYSKGSSFFLKRVPQGAAMMLADGVEIRILTAGTAGRWYFQVADGKDDVSWLDVLMAYDFIADWYLAEAKSVAILPPVPFDGAGLPSRPAEPVVEND